MQKFIIARTVRPRRCVLVPLLGNESTMSPAICIAWFVSSLLLSSVPSGSFAQESATTTLQKPVTSPVRTLEKQTGSTFVSFETGLERIARGGEPSTLAELQALEKQQEKVASQINKVTVNVQQGSAQGSGVIITPDGFVLTAAHVAGRPGRTAIVKLSDGRTVKAKTLGTNRGMDAGLLQITDKKGAPWPHATLGESKDLRLGQWLIAAGHPGGWISDRPAVIRVGRVLQMMKSTLVTDCALIGGDSGGPLFDLNGRLIGIHSRIGSETTDNMHVPIDVYRDSWDRMAQSQSWGTLPGFTPMIGVEGSASSARAEVSSIAESGPAARSGIRPGDIILSYDGNSISSFTELQRAVEESLPGDRVEIRYERQGELMRARIIVGIADP